MSSTAKKRPDEKHGHGLLQFPDRTAYRTVAEYNANVKAYWKTIDMYRDLATEFHREIMGTRNRGPFRGKEKSDAKLEE